MDFFIKSRLFSTSADLFEDLFITTAMPLKVTRQKI